MVSKIDIVAVVRWLTLFMVEKESASLVKWLAQLRDEARDATERERWDLYLRQVRNIRLTAKRELEMIGILKGTGDE